jgi:hypothetical protein
MALFLSSQLHESSTSNYGNQEPNQNYGDQVLPIAKSLGGRVLDFPWQKLLVF